MDRAELQRTNALRGVLLLAITIAALAHLPPTAEHLEEAPYMGQLFVLFTDGCLVLGALSIARPARWVYAASAALCAAAVAAYAATRVVAFPMLADDVGNWTETLGLVSVVAETVVVLTAVALLKRATYAVNRQPVLVRRPRNVNSGGTNHG